MRLLLVAAVGAVLITAGALLAVAWAMGLFPPEAYQVYETETAYSFTTTTYVAEGPPEDVLPPELLELLASASKLVSEAYPGYNVTCVAARYEHDYGYLMLFVLYNRTYDMLIQVNAPNGDALYIVGGVKPVLNTTELVLNTTIPVENGTHRVVARISSYAIPLYYGPPAVGITGYWWSLKCIVIWCARVAQDVFGRELWRLNATMKVYYYYGYRFTLVLDRSYAWANGRLGWRVAHFASDALRWGGWNNAMCWATGQFDNWLSGRSDKAWVGILFDVYENLETPEDQW